MENTIQEPEITEWIHPKTGETRRYINNLEQIVGLELNFYKTGNISSATLKGGYISNTQASELACCLGSWKFWVDESGQLHIDTPWHAPRSNRAMSKDEIRADVEAWLTGQTETEQA